MKKRNFIQNIVKSIMAGCFAITMLCTGMMSDVHAAEYEIVFKAGAHGTIDGNKSVSYRMAYGDVFPNEPTVQSESGYAFDGWNKELPEVGSSVTGKEVYVARYITLVDGVEYRVRYVDELGTDIATQKVSITENGKVVEERAKVLAGYTFDQAVKSLNVTKNSRELVFVYTLTDQNAATTNPPVIATTPTETQTNNTQTNNTQTNNTPTVDVTNQTPNQNPDVNPTPDTDPDQEEVIDPETPQGGGDEEEVDDNETPLANLNDRSMGLMLGIGGIIAIGAVIVILVCKKRNHNA